MLVAHCGSKTAALVQWGLTFHQVDLQIVIHEKTIAVSTAQIVSIVKWQDFVPLIAFVNHTMDIR